MSLKIYNDLTNKKEEFVPIIKGKVGMYVCGVTVYGSPHLGHAKSYVSFDIVSRYLRYLGYDVKYVQNITDVGHLVGDGDSGESKIEKQAKLEQIDPYQIAYKYEKEYFDCMDKLNVKKPDISSRATGHIMEIIDMVKVLIDKGYAYVTDEQNVYYDVRKFKDYGKLSHRDVFNTVSGERIKVADDKRNPEDFALWKHADNNHLMKWDSPWGLGYPGWHIECSVMSKKYLGDTFDIHGGGMDNIFPHHECEIAQSEAANGVKFVNYFMHNNLVTVEGQKMGKSLGNFITLPELFEKYNPTTIRFYILESHYRRPTDFSDAQIQEAEKNIKTISRSLNKAISFKQENYEYSEEIKAIKDKFLSAMDDDFNTSLAISYLYEASKLINSTSDTNILSSAVDFFENDVEKILGINFAVNVKNDNSVANKLVEYLIELRNDAKKNKNYELSDKLRDDLKNLGVTLNDTREGTTYEIN